MARILVRRQSSTALGTGSSTLADASLPIDRNAFLQQVILDLKAQVNTGAGSLTNPRRWFTNMSLVFNGSSTYFSLRSLYLFHLNKRDYHTEPVMDTYAASTANQSVRAQWVMDTRPRTNIPNDFSALIPAFRANTLNLNMRWEAAATLLGGAGLNFNYTNMDIHNVEVVPDSPEETTQLLKSIWAISVTEREDNFTATTSNYANTVNVPTGSLVKDVHLFMQSPAGVANINDTLLDTGATSTDAAFRVNLTKPSQQTLYESTGYDSVNKDKTELELETRDAGVTRYDPWSDVGGLPLENLDEGSVRMEFNNTVNTGRVDSVFRRYVRK